jgi:FkbM family methyltransferase
VDEIKTPPLQAALCCARRLVPRGWAPLLKLSARVIPALQSYQAILETGDYLYLDLRESMCLGYFFNRGLPHEAAGIELLRRVLGPGGTFVDVGANVGFFSRMAAGLVGREGRVIAIEALPAALRLLRRNLDRLPCAKIVPTAVDRFAGRAIFYARRAGDQSSLSPSADATEIEVEVSTLDAILADEAPPGLIKIDAEGFELQILEGALGTIRRARPVVYFELIEWLAVQEGGVGVSAFREFFAVEGYAAGWLTPSAGVAAPQPGVASYVVAVPSERLGVLDGLGFEALRVG